MQSDIPRSMRAARLAGPRQFEIIDVPVPVVADGECLIRLDIVSVCGSDIRKGYRADVLEGGFPGPPGFPGHECAGVVVESRAPAVQPGTRVIVHPHGLTGLVEFLVASPRRFAALPAAGDLATWLMAEPPATVLHACRQLPSLFGKSAIVLGQGMIGLCWTRFLDRLGAEQIVAIEPRQDRLARAYAMGATTASDAQGSALVAFAREATGGRLFDVVVDAAGEVESARIAPSLAAHGGTVVWFATPAETHIEMDFRVIRERELRTLSTAPGRGEAPGRVIAEMVSLVERGWFDLDGFVTRTMPFAEVQRAFDLYDDPPPGQLKIALSLR